MKILHILNHVKRTGNGIVNVAVDLACIQSQGGNNVAVASIGGEFEALLDANYVKHYKLDQSRKPAQLIRSLITFRRIVNEFKPDIIHAHMMTGVVLSKFCKIFSKYRIVTTVHNEWQRSSTLMKLGDRVIAVSAAVEQAMIQRGVDKEKIRVVLNGTLDSPRGKNLNEYAAKPLNTPAIVTVAGMFQRKGIIDLISAFEQVAARFPEPHLYLVGDGPDRISFEQIANRSAYNHRIHFEGFQPEPQRYLLASDIFVLASLNEPFGLVLTEAREAGCAVVASNVGGIPEALDHGEAGILVSPGNVEELANVLSTLLTDKTKLELYKKKAQQNIERFNVSRVNDETMQVYRELVI